MINIPKGTKDVLPDESYRWQYVEKTARKIASLYSLKEIRTPTFEGTRRGHRQFRAAVDSHVPHTAP